MKTIQIKDYYNDNEAVGLRVEPIKLNEQEQSCFGTTHYAKLTSGQIKKLTRGLSNGPRNVNVTDVDRMQNPLSGECYFNMD